MAGMRPPGGEAPNAPGGPAGMPGMMRGMAGSGGPGGAMPGAMGAGGVATANADKSPDYSKPETAVQTFIDAAKNKNLSVLAEATALRAATNEEITQKQRQFLESLKNENVDQGGLDELARAFDGVEILSQNQARSTHSRSLTVGKTEEGKLITRTVYVRLEKDGWKIMGFSGQRSQNVGVRPDRRAGASAATSGR